ncbi:MAG: DUF4266 domain-containing protein [Planctomycetota bacterium]|nr:DUF4266 domain-containing protein [Planctomycetota bacterium]
MTRVRCRARALFLLLLACSPLAGCGSVEFYERRHLAERHMLLDDGPGEAHFYQKTIYSMEGSAGGVGASAGGGCGCY